jgi:hypothetical protein
MFNAFSGSAARAYRPWRDIAHLLALLLLYPATGMLWGQEPTDEVLTPRPGLHVESLSGYAVYYSSGLPESSVQPTGVQLPSDLGLGGSALLEWTHTGEKSQVLLTYTPSYTGRLRFAAWNALNHSMSFNASRHFGKWKLGFAANGDLSNLSEFLFSPTVFASVAAVPVTFNDLAAAILTGNFTNPQLASLLTGAPLVESPARSLFFGERMFTSAAQTSLAYAPSSRLSVTLSASASRSQHLSDPQSLAAQSTYLIPKTTSAAASLVVSYSRSPRTQLGASVSSNRIVSALQDVYSTTLMASLGRTMGRRWFVQLSGGLGKMAPVRNTLVLSTAPRPVANASLGFRTLSHTFLSSYSRSVGDSYGLGANSTSSATGSWRWARPNLSWWIESTVGWQQLAGSAYANSSGWRMEAGFGRAMGDQVALLTQYVYLHYSQQLASIPPLSQSAVRVSMVWNRDPRAFH